VDDDDDDDDDDDAASCNFTLYKKSIHATGSGGP
jgi:hypothetical protein